MRCGGSPWCAVGRALSAAWRQPATRPSNARRLNCQRPRGGGARRFAAQATKRRRGRTARCPPCGRKPIKNKAVARPRDDHCDRVAQRLGQRTTKRGRPTVQWRKSGLGDPPRATPRANDDSLTLRDVGARVGHGPRSPSAAGRNRRPRGVTVSTLDSESSDRGSNPREALLHFLFLAALRCPSERNRKFDAIGRIRRRSAAMPSRPKSPEIILMAVWGSSDSLRFGKRSGTTGERPARGARAGKPLKNTIKWHSPQLFTRLGAYGFALMDVWGAARARSARGEMSEKHTKMA